VYRHSQENPWHYFSLDQRQREIAHAIITGKISQGAILLSEVAPVITLGRRTKESEKHLLLSKATFQSLGIDLYPTDRGGLATFHGKGQWILFVVDTLEALTGDPRGVRKAIEGLLNIAHSVGEMYVSKPEIRRKNNLGVWDSRGKFASLGVHIENRIFLHGLSINGYQTPLSFMGLRPCGLESPPSYLMEREENVAFEDLGKKIIEAARDQFWGKLYKIRFHYKVLQGYLKVLVLLFPQFQ
jgi:lipoate-protein ligase B